MKQPQNRKRFTGGGNTFFHIIFSGFWFFFFLLSPVFHSLHSLKSMEEIRGDSSYCRTAGQEVLDLPLTIQSETDFTESQTRAGSP